MSEMMKRVGAAILLAETQWGPKSKVSKEAAMAEAALLALRDPTQAMIKAGASHWYGDRSGENATDTWKDMIDTALHEPL